MGFFNFSDDHSGDNYQPEYTHFLGIAIGKKAKARKTEKKAVKIDKRKAKVENLRSKAQSRLELAKQGIVTPGVGDTIAKSLGGVASMVGNIMGGGGPADAPQSLEDQATYAPPIVNPIYNPAPIGKISDEMKQVTEPGDTTALAQQQALLAQLAAAKTPDDKKDDKNKNLPFIIGGIAIAVMLVVVVLLKKN